MCRDTPLTCIRVTFVRTNRNPIHLSFDHGFGYCSNLFWKQNTRPLHPAEVFECLSDLVTHDPMPFVVALFEPHQCSKPLRFGIIFNLLPDKASQSPVLSVYDGIAGKAD